VLFSLSIICVIGFKFMWLDVNANRDGLLSSDHLGIVTDQKWLRSVAKQHQAPALNRCHMRVMARSCSGESGSGTDNRSRTSRGVGAGSSRLAIAGRDVDVCMYWPL
jgi:hypothetical protein